MLRIKCVQIFKINAFPFFLQRNFLVLTKTGLTPSSRKSDSLVLYLMLKKKAAKVQPVEGPTNRISNQLKV